MFKLLVSSMRLRPGLEPFPRPRASSCPMSNRPTLSALLPNSEIPGSSVHREYLILNVSATTMSTRARVT
eukprot:8468043-Pyramimonas_sp.AAC.1